MAEKSEISNDSSKIDSIGVAGKKQKEYHIEAVFNENGKTFEQLMEEAFKQIISNGR